MSLTVVATGNHYVFDVLAGMVMTASGFAVWQLNARRGDLLALVPRPSWRSPGRVRQPSPREAAVTT